MQRTRLNDISGLRPTSGRRPRLEELEQRTVPALVVNDLNAGITPTQLVNTLTGSFSGVAVSNVVFTGDNVQAGVFSGGTGIIGFESGIVLGSGDVKDVSGPNNGNAADTSLGGAGDPDLETLQTGTQDAATIQFDFVTLGDTLRFTYVFSSEEYNDFVGFNVNDVFGFFLNGQNIALLPGTNTVVSIDTVNLGANSQFYINNADAIPVLEPTPAAGPLLDTQMDGLTVVLTVQVPVTPGVRNNIKLGIADVGDMALDSNVFLQAGSFRAPPAPVFTNYRPLRYAFRDVDQNLGQRGPLPLQGPANQPSFDGNLTILNSGDAPAIGNIIVTVSNLPAGAVLLNPTGVTPTGVPVIQINNVFLNPGEVLRVPVKILNTGLAPLGTYFVGPFEYDVEVA